MPPLPQARDGERLETLGRPTPFSFWPTERKSAHAKAQSILFSLNPWLLLKEVVTRKCEGKRRPEALACLEQSRDFFVAGTEKGIESARPLALYYSYMNLVKAFCLTHGNTPSFDQAQHGLSTQPDTNGRTGLEHSLLEAYPSPNAQKRQVFAELKETLTSQTIGAKLNYRLMHVFPQILPGHRLWGQAAGQKERFISFHDIQFIYSKETHKVWLRLHLVAHDLSRLHIGHGEFLKTSNLHRDFREVQCNDKNDGYPLICFEQITPEEYPVEHPADVLDRLVNMIKPRLWATITLVPPYRRFYAYLCPQGERNSLLPQILSVYALTYYFGSITRYRPQDFESVLKGKYGPRIQDFITGQPLQFLYLMASEIARQDITKPSIL